MPFGNIKNWADAIEKLEDYKFRQLISNSGLNDFIKSIHGKLGLKKYLNHVMLNILHIIPTLNIGGAERQLLNLVSTDKEFNHCIVALLGCKKKFLRVRFKKRKYLQSRRLSLILKLKEIIK